MPTTAKFIVQRIEEHGAMTRTVELHEDEAASIYSNWCKKVKSFNDQSISLIRVTKTETPISRHVNTSFKEVI